MLTPQDLLEKKFDKAVFGGYDMQTVDEFVEPLVQDYIALYNENAVLKDKLRVLVKKLEEFRDEEDARKASIAAQEQACAEKLQQTEEACRVMLAKAEATAASRNSEEQVAQEEQRLNCAKELALNFISVLEQDIQGHMNLYAADMAVGDGLLQLFHGKVFGIAAGIELAVAQINSISAVLHGGAQRLHGTGGRK